MASLTFFYVIMKIAGTGQNCLLFLISRRTRKYECLISLIVLRFNGHLCLSRNLEKLLREIIVKDYAKDW